MDSKICKPALIYLVIALIMLCVGIIIRIDSFNLTATCSQLSSIILCTLVLMGICTFAPQLSMAFTIIFIICTIIALISMIMEWIAQPMMA